MVGNSSIWGNILSCVISVACGFGQWLTDHWLLLGLFGRDDSMIILTCLFMFFWLKRESSENSQGQVHDQIDAQYQFSVFRHDIWNHHYIMHILPRHFHGISENTAYREGPKASLIVCIAVV